MQLSVADAWSRNVSAWAIMLEISSMALFVTYVLPMEKAWADEPDLSY
jgi:hypothetical protein